MKMTKILSLATVCALFIGMNAARAQSTVITYQGCVLDNGTNFTGAGQFQFALVTSINANQTATATANAPSGGYITGYTVTKGGSGYVTAPAVTIVGGGGSGASATAHISGGAVTSISVNNTGTGGYTSPPTVTIAPPPANITYTTYWSNDGTSSAGSEPSTAVGVAVTNGLFTVVLGDTTIANMTAINAALFAQPNLQLRIWFNDGVNGFSALSPVQNLTPTPYAITAQNASILAGTLPVAQLSGTVGNGQLANSSITVNAGTGLSGGGTAALGGSTTLNNAGVLSVTGNADITASPTSGAVILGSTATSANTISTIVKRDTSGNFSAGTIAAALAGNASTATSATTANSFSGSLSGDVTGTQSATLVATVGGVTAANVASGANAANAATSANTASTLVKRDSNGSFSAGNITLANNLNLPGTTSSSGIIYFGGSPYLHTFGSFNFFGGLGAGNFTAAGSDNVGIGASALSQSTGNANTAIGYLAMSGNNTGNANIALGVSAGSHLTTGSRNICIGNQGVAGDDGTTRIGDPAYTYSTVIAGIYGNNIANAIPVYISPAGSLGTSASSAKFKQNIESMGDTSDVLLDLRPVTFQYKPDIDPEGVPQYGLVAEDVEKVDPDLVVHDAEHGIYTVRYQAVDAMLLNEFLKEHRKVEAQDTEIKELKSRLEKLEEFINLKNGGVK